MTFDVDEGEIQDVRDHMEEYRQAANDGDQLAGRMLHDLGLTLAYIDQLEAKVTSSIRSADD